MNTFWTEEKIKALKKAVAQGLSGSQIALRIGAATRNVVIGKVARLQREYPALKLRRAARPQSKRTKSARERLKLQWFGKRNLVPKKQNDNFVLPPRPAGEPSSRQLELKDLEKNECRFPHGEGSSIRFCGHPVSRGSYCEYHANLCMVKVDDYEC